MMLAAAVALTATVASAQMRGLGTINGSLQSDTGEPVSGASVRFLLANGDALEGKSDATGKWAVSGIGKGEWQVEISASGFATRRIKVVVEREVLKSEPVKVVIKKG
jgi:hypothetical protein